MGNRFFTSKTGCGGELHFEDQGQERYSQRKRCSSKEIQGIELHIDGGGVQRSLGGSTRDKLNQTTAMLGRSE